jgi:hypothetical protein
VPPPGGIQHQVRRLDELGVNGDPILGIVAIEACRILSVEQRSATFHLPEDLMNEARNTVVALSRPPHRLTLAKLAENALRNELERLKGRPRRPSARQGFFPSGRTRFAPAGRSAADRPPAKP